MTENQFRKLALSLPQAVESSHMGHPDFRVAHKIFASLLTGGAATATVKLSCQQQRVCLDGWPDVFVPAVGGWGRKGWTTIRLKSARSPEVREVLLMAWRNTAPPKLLREHDGE